VDLEDQEEIRQRIEGVLKAHFRPEFLNRIDEKIVFGRLQESAIIKIVDIQIRLLQRRLEDKKITIDLTEPARKFLAKEGYDPVYGARPLKRTIQKLVQDPLALKILQGEIKERDHVTIDQGKKGELGFRVK
ncbi:MAG: type VI secretion system ATPase TssH, partial [Candidatus Omnitrophica bacterium]|nr:type VI secretion system ATPase TssH [Candidatus Omnitrophota bacterium]